MSCSNLLTMIRRIAQLLPILLVILMTSGVIGAAIGALSNSVIAGVSVTIMPLVFLLISLISTEILDE